MASTIAKHLLLGASVTVLNCQKIVISGHLVRNKLRLWSFHNKRMNTNPKRGLHHPIAPCRLFFRCVRGMMPHKTVRGRALMKRLRCYDGMPPRFTHVRKVRAINCYRVLRLNPSAPYTVLGDLAKIFGWTKGALIKKFEVKRKIRQQVKPIFCDFANI